MCKVLLIFLVLLSIQDLTKRQLSGVLLTLFGVSGVCYRLYAMLFAGLMEDSGLFGAFDAWGGIGVGLLLLLSGWLTKESIGYGDGVVFCVTGLYLGLWQNLLLLFVASLLCALVGSVLLFTKRCGRKQRLPFVPFVLVGEILLLLLQGG